MQVLLKGLLREDSMQVATSVVDPLVATGKVVRSMNSVNLKNSKKLPLDVLDGLLSVDLGVA
jgi:hypothetical protein|tara:strand:- start:198 stop:383 length:186 start_codon:yes stop_codon:yes gene_type:complete